MREIKKLTKGGREREKLRKIEREMRLTKRERLRKSEKERRIGKCREIEIEKKTKIQRA